MQRFLFVLFLLALTQITGWGAVSVLPVIATTVATEFRTTGLVSEGESAIAASADRQSIHVQPFGDILVVR